MDKISLLTPFHSMYWEEPVKVRAIFGSWLGCYAVGLVHHELQQRVSGMPNFIQLFKFLLDTLVESFFALFGPLEDASSFKSVGR
jgi:hypothetical protein